MARDTYLVAGCAAAGAAFLAAGILAGRHRARVRGSAVVTARGRAGEAARAASALVRARRAGAGAVRPRPPVPRPSVRAADAPPRRRRPTARWHRALCLPGCASSIRSSAATRRIGRGRIGVLRGPRSPGFCSAATRWDATSSRACCRRAAVARRRAALDAAGARARRRWSAPRRATPAAGSDAVLMRLADLVIVLPGIYVVLALRGRAAAGADHRQVFVALVAVLALVGWPACGTRSTRNRPRRTPGRSTQKLRARSARARGA